VQDGNGPLQIEVWPPQAQQLSLTSASRKRQEHQGVEASIRAGLASGEQTISLFVVKESHSAAGLLWPLDLLRRIVVQPFQFADGVGKNVAQQREVTNLGGRSGWLPSIPGRQRCLGLGDPSRRDIAEETRTEAIRPPAELRLSLGLFQESVLREDVHAVLLDQIVQSMTAGLTGRQLTTGPNVGLKLLRPQAGVGLAAKDPRLCGVSFEAHTRQPGRLSVSSLPLLDSGHDDAPFCGLLPLDCH
jgi:hypothetical protein